MGFHGYRNAKKSRARIRENARNPRQDSKTEERYKNARLRE
jgi:hypothetical protein